MLDELRAGRENGFISKNIVQIPTSVVWWLAGVAWLIRIVAVALLDNAYQGIRLRTSIQRSRHRAGRPLARMQAR